MQKCHLGPSVDLPGGADSDCLMNLGKVTILSMANFPYCVHGLFNSAVAAVRSDAGCFGEMLSIALALLGWIAIRAPNGDFFLST